MSGPGPASLYPDMRVLLGSLAALALCAWAPWAALLLGAGATAWAWSRARRRVYLRALARDAGARNR
ncbi:MAG: hypothetical protein DRH08_00055 [Deltaproteobacteria bacterium]|nr:MAG: hypothetical protein DRH08_00055 [Deltaproteobacteria bacterium]